MSYHDELCDRIEEEIHKLYNEILKRAEEGDDEMAHSIEDELRREVLHYILTISADRQVRDLVSLALSTGNLKFSRWCG